MPSPPAQIEHIGPGLQDIREIDILNHSFDFTYLTFLSSMAPDVYPERALASVDTPAGGYVFDFHNGSAVLDIGDQAGKWPASRITWTVTEDNLFYSDITGDGFLDLLMVVDQQIDRYESEADRDHGHPVESTQSRGIVVTPYAHGGLGQTMFIAAYDDVTDVSAIENGFSYTVTAGGYSDTVEFGMPNGYPERIDEYGGAVLCTTDIEQIRQILETEPRTTKAMAAYPEGEPTDWFEEWTYFDFPAAESEANPQVFSGTQRTLYLLDGGDMNRWTDYRCGWRS